MNSAPQTPGAPSLAASPQRRGDSSSNPGSFRYWHTARPWQTNAALILLGIGLFFLTRQLISEYDHFTIGLSGVSGWSLILYVAAVFLILTQPTDRYTLPIIFTVAITCRLVALFADPYLSSDIYRYVWDGIVQHAHISPYRYVPGNPALAFLREPNQDIYDNINRRDYAHTIYPPVAQGLFYLITWISPTVICMKTAMVLFEGVTTYALLQLLTLLGKPRTHILLYAWCPLLIWEIAGSGHVDSIAMAFIALALLARYRDQPIATGLWLAFAVLTKLYPVILLPALLSRRPPQQGTEQTTTPTGAPCQDASFLTWGRHPLRLLNLMNTLKLLRNLNWRTPTVCLATIALGYAAYASVGKLVFGFLGGYVAEEGMTTGTRYFLLELTQKLPGLHNASPTAYLLVCAIVFAALTLWALRISLNPGPWTTTPAFALATALMLLFSPHYPWYILWLIPFFTLLPNLPILTYLMAMFYLCTTAIATGSGPQQFLLNKYLYGSLLLAVIIHVVLNRFPIHRTLFSPPRPTA